ncbi:MAG: hypothetical protein IPK26_21185 [Planctomycetes bacterium]|nr:hypothetical protein [Planctomycetota bacterium]
MTTTTLRSFCWMCALLRACASPTAAQDPQPAAPQTALHDAGVKAPLTLYPVHLLGQPNAQVAEALGLVLERYGMPDLEIAAAFTLPADTAWDAIPTRFAAHVKQTAAGQPARWHVYAQFLGTPKTGPDEVRFVVVDATGAVVCSDRQTHADADFQRTAAKDPDPLGCSTLVAERLFTLADWRKAPGSVKDGKLTQRWREKSGVPDRKQLAAMKTRLQALQKDLANARFVVLPVLRDGGQDAAAAARLAQACGEALGSAKATAGEGKLEVPPSSNEQKRLWDLARAVGKAVAGQQLAGEHRIGVDLGFDRERGSGFVHVVVCTAAGEPVVVDFVNDQNPVWTKAAPKELADLEAIAVARLRTLLR